MSRKGVDLGGDGDANVALNPIVGLAREDLLGAVSVMLRETAAKPSTTLKHARLFTDDVIKILSEELAKNEIEAKVTGRPKHMWSIYQKTVKTGREVDQLFDIIAFRALVQSVRDCYGALGVVHTKWTPIPGRFKDFIALPKPNMYQSLHTSVIGPKAERIEVQIRTEEMHRVAEDGIAAAIARGSAGEAEDAMRYHLDQVVEIVTRSLTVSSPSSDRMSSG